MKTIKQLETRLTLVVGLTLLVASLPGCTTKPLMQVQLDAATGQYRFLDAGQPVLQYNYATVNPPTGYLEKVHPNNRKYAAPRSNYIHPLFGPQGEQLTLDFSLDHPHHRGIYWAWPEVQFQGKTADLHALQNVFARPTGKIKIRYGNNFAEIQAENRWLWEDKTPIVHEITNIRAYQANDNGRYIDLTFTFTPLVDGVTLARRGTNHYGGLNIRLSPIKQMKLNHYADPAGTPYRAAWQSATGTWTGATKPTVLAVFEKADNPDYPSDYIQYPDLPWFQPTFPRADTRYELKKNQPLVLRYRLWIRSGPPPTAAQYRQQWNLFQNTK
ncbi:MAG: PmoA family protein [Sedimentisphaerales bacterium]|nr:PmoA family protein [Sedimentisphaerales bacterium]